MNGNHEPSSPSLTILVASLSPWEVDELLQVFRQLSVDDLRVLTAFPSQPHPLIHAVLACVHCLLLSLSTQKPSQQQENLEAPLWPLLRLELLTNTLQVWEKLAKRLQKLQHHHLGDGKRKLKKPVLVQSQLRFAYRALEPFYEKNGETGKVLMTTTKYPVALEMYARVSSISAQLAAWVLLCLFYASSPAYNQATRTEYCRPRNGAGGSRSSLKSPVLSPLSPPGVRQIRGRDQQVTPVKQVPVVENAISARAGLKIGGRFYLFQANVSELGRSSSILHTQGSLSPQRHERQNESSLLAQWAVFRMDTNWRSNKLRKPNNGALQTRPTIHEYGTEAKSSSDDGFWSPRQRIPAVLSQSVCVRDQLYYRIPRLALVTTLLQLGLHARIFENPARLHPVSTTPTMSTPPPLMLKFASVVVSNIPAAASELKQIKKPRQSLVLAGIGNVMIRPNQSVADLRVEIHAALIQKPQLMSPGSRISQSPGCSFDFLFLYRGSLLPRALEASISVVALMPFALLCQAAAGTKGAAQAGLVSEAPSLPSAPAVRQYAIPLQRLHIEISVALRNAAPPNHLPHIAGHEAPPLDGHGDNKVDVAYYPMQQEVVFETQATSAIVAEFFVNWRAFVHFQLLQDSTLVLELSAGDDQRNKRKKHVGFKTEAQKIADFQVERDHLQLQSKETGPALPSKRFNPEKEYLKPLYALADVQSATTALLTTPFALELFRELFSDINNNNGGLSPAMAMLRLVLYDEDFLIHVTSARVLLSSSSTDREAHTRLTCSLSPSSGPQLQIEFKRDASCSLSALLLLRNAYVWQIVKLRPIQASRQLLNHREETRDQAPAKWLQDVWRFVTHPQFDFFTKNYSYNASSSSSCTSRLLITYFRVPISCKRVEIHIETDFWSKTIDWTRFLHSTNIRDCVLRKKYDQMCRSHPPSYAIDSVKFSKLLREIGVQPHLLSIGDAAFLFASHTAPGSHYEMDLDGFLQALTKIAEFLYPEPSSPKKKKKHKSQPISITINDSDNAKLARLFFERMLDAPSVTPIWSELVNEWRLQCKRDILHKFTREYGAATRIQALWKRFATRKQHLKALLRMRCERKAATKLQSLERKRTVYQPFHRLRMQTVKVQLRIKARHELRILRREREAFVEVMRVRIVKWMKRRLRVLREWKKINRIWVLRRERIWAKRKRLICVAVCRLEIKSVRISLYHAADAIAADKYDSVALSPVLGRKKFVGEGSAIMEEEKWYELEILEPITCWWRSVRVSQGLIDQFIQDEDERTISGCSGSGSVTPQRSTLCNSPSDDDKGSKELNPGAPLIQGNRSLGLTSGPRGAKTRSDSSLRAVLRRLYLHAKFDRVEYYRDPIQTSLGKLVFKGAVSVRFRKFNTVPDDEVYGKGDNGDSHVIVKMLQSAASFKVLAYFPSTSELRRWWDFSAGFAFQVLQFMRFRQMTLLPARTPTDFSDVSTVHDDREEDQFPTLFELQGFLKLGSRDSLVAIRSIVCYLMAFGLAPPQYENMVEVVAEKRRLRREKDALELGIRRVREEKLVVFVQACVRRALARKHRLRLALATYKKQFDLETGGFVYVHRRSIPGGGELAMHCREKPRSLLDCDVSMPPDEWQQVHEPISASEAAAQRFFNPFRGIFSQFNEEKAARQIQSWFRRKTWIGVSNWGLQQLARALRYHQQTLTKPAALSPAAADEDVEAITRYAFHLHIMEHEFKGAFTIYEAVLKIRPDDVETLVGLAVLLIYSCRYPIKQTWPRAQSLIAQARAQIIVGGPLTECQVLKSVEENCFCWKMFLEPKNAHAMGNYAVFLQCIYHEFDKVKADAELLYRRAIDADPSNEFVIENYRRLERERTPEGVYSFAGPSKIARWRAEEVERVGMLWAVMEDSAARIPNAQRFYRNLQTGMCQWQQPAEN